MRGEIQRKAPQIVGSRPANETRRQLADNAPSDMPNAHSEKKARTLSELPSPECDHWEHWTHNYLCQKCVPRFMLLL